MSFQLLQFSKTIMLFAHKNVNMNAISCNKLVLLHGPPGEISFHIPNIHLKSVFQIMIHNLEIINASFIFLDHRYRKDQSVQSTGSKGLDSHEWQVWKYPIFRKKWPIPIFWRHRFYPFQISVHSFVWNQQPQPVFEVVLWSKYFKNHHQQYLYYIRLIIPLETEKKSNKNSLLSRFVSSLFILFHLEWQIGAQVV